MADMNQGGQLTQEQWSQLMDMLQGQKRQQNPYSSLLAYADTKNFLNQFNTDLMQKAKAGAGEQYGYDVGAAGIYGVPKAMPQGLALGKYGLPAIYGYITKGSEQAQQSLMSAYRQAYALRAAGIAGSYGLQMDQLQSEMLGQGMSADVARRIAAGQRGSALQQLGEAQAGAAGEYYTSLAQLQKGTGTELAAAKQAEIEQILAPHIAQISGQYAAKAGKAQGMGSFLGAIAGGLIGKI